MLYFDDLFNDVFDNGFNLINGSMKSDLLESNGAYLLTIDLPGVSKDDVSIEYNDDVLEVTAKKPEADLKDGKYVSRERFSSDLKRTYEIPGINCEEIKAKMVDGVLEIVLPKLEAKETKRIISIE